MLASSEIVGQRKHEARSMKCARGTPDLSTVLGCDNTSSSPSPPGTATAGAARSTSSIAGDPHSAIFAVEPVREVPHGPGYPTVAGMTHVEAATL